MSARNPGDEPAGRTTRTGSQGRTGRVARSRSKTRAGDSGRLSGSGRIAEAVVRLWHSTLARRLASVLLFGWFVYWTWQVIGDNFGQWPYHMDVVGTDGRLYYRAAQTWLAGGDPWTAYVTQNSFPLSGLWVKFLFTGPPPTVLAFVPFAWIPETIFVIGWLGASVAAAFYTLRRLHLPAW